MKLSDFEVQRAAGHRWLRFVPAIETCYRHEREAALPERARPVAASALFLFLVYALLDPVFLPQSLAWQTIAMRLLFTCPMIGFVWALTYLPPRSGPNPPRLSITPAYFARWYALSYLWGGLSVVLIIALARNQHYPMPYDGILLMLMFGYFLMGLPFRTASIGSALIIAAYLLVEVIYQTSPKAIGVNMFFVMTANVIGMVGAWLREHQQRAHFIDRQLLELSRHKAETDSAEKTHLISVASHDLRQPLNVINLLLENLSATRLSDDQAPMVDRLQRSVSHFNGLLGSLLDISRIQENMVRPLPETLVANDALQQMVDTCFAVAQRAGISLRISSSREPLTVRADPHLLHRILQNLIVNAIQHSQGQLVTLGISSGDRVHRLWVKDDGCGLDENTQHRIFDTFYRADTTDNSDPGLGLGLAITRELTQLMGGRYGITSAKGEGSLFWIELPAGTIPDQSAAIPLEPAGSQRLSRLLLIEDDTDSRQGMAAMLQRWGYQVVEADSAEAARAQVARQPFDLVISDLHLPAESGRELYRFLRSTRQVQCGVLVTADTGEPQAYIREDNLWLMHKPLVPSRLRAVLQRLQKTGISEGFTTVDDCLSPPIPVNGQG
ncbi:hybrid sensor histidine kinase/response regulator [Marinobacter sp. 1Y8]